SINRFLILHGRLSPTCVCLSYCFTATVFAKRGREPCTTEAENKRGYFRGVGKFHIYGNAAQALLVKQVVDFAAARNLYLLAHCDEAALLILLAHNRSAKIIWAHTGFSTPTRRVRELLETYPELMGELSYRGGISEGGGKLAAEWRELFARHSDRFLL